jgi:hypothetical protein
MVIGCSIILSVIFVEHSRKLGLLIIALFAKTMKLGIILSNNLRNASKATNIFTITRLMLNDAANVLISSIHGIHFESIITSTRVIACF